MFNKTIFSKTIFNKTMYQKTMMFVFMALIVSGVDARTDSPKGSSAYIISPSHGEIVSSPVTVQFGLKGMGVAPAGTAKAKTGHHHLLIDKSLSSMDKGIPKDKNHKHFGGGQTEATIELSPGRHTLQLMMGDKGHVPHNPPVMSQKITIFVK